MIAARYKRKGKESKYVINKKLPAGLAVEGILAHVNFLCRGITAAAGSVPKVIWLISLFTVFTGSFPKRF